MCARLSVNNPPNNTRKLLWKTVTINRKFAKFHFFCDHLNCFSCVNYWLCFEYYIPYPSTNFNQTEHLPLPRSFLTCLPNPSHYALKNFLMPIYGQKTLFTFYSARQATFNFGNKYHQMESSDVIKQILRVVNRSSH